LALLLALLDDEVQLADLADVGLDFLLLLVDIRLIFFEDTSLLLDRFVLLLVLEMLLSKLQLLEIDLFLQLTDLVVDDLISTTDLSNLLLCLREVLTVQVTITSNCLVQILLLLQLGLRLDVLSK
jgi:hypothetical protein